MMAQALGYLALDYPAVRADDAGGFSGPVHDADFIVQPSRLQHPCCAVGVFLPAAKGAGRTVHQDFEAFVSARLHFYT
jgi:hypothetical protein